MISYIKGELAEVLADAVVVEAGGIGYEIFVSPRLVAKLPGVGAVVKVYTFLNVKEDGVSLFGFESRAEVEMFQKLRGVSGVGPKMALAILAELEPHQIVMAVLSGDVKALTNAQGVGKKIAQRVILELKDKFHGEEAVAEEFSALPVKEMGEGAQWEAIDAMTALGYSRTEAAKAVSAVAQEGMSTEEILKAALKKMITF